MRALWNVVSFLAVVHLLALAMFVAWLWRTQRLDADRVQQIRAVLGTTVGEAREQERSAAEEEMRQRQKQDEEARRRNPPLSSVGNVSSLQRAQEAGLQSARHIDDTRAQLERQIDLTAQQVRVQRSALDAQRQGMMGELAASQQQEKQQMARAVRLLESLPPKLAKLRLLELAGTGRMDQAVAYLNAMNPRNAARVLAEFKTGQDNKLATELLERIRTLRLPKAAPLPEPGNAQPSPAAPAIP